MPRQRRAPRPDDDHRLPEDAARLVDHRASAAAGTRLTGQAARSRLLRLGRRAHRMVVA
jgi:hypothetical protein